MAILEAAI